MLAGSRPDDGAKAAVAELVAVDEAEEQARQLAAGLPARPQPKRRAAAPRDQIAAHREAAAPTGGAAPAFDTLATAAAGTECSKELTAAHMAADEPFKNEAAWRQGKAHDRLCLL